MASHLPDAPRARPWVLLHHQRVAAPDRTDALRGEPMTAPTQEVRKQRERLARHFGVRVGPLASIGPAPRPAVFMGGQPRLPEKRSPMLRFPWVSQFSRASLPDGCDTKEEASRFVADLAADAAVAGAELVPPPVPCKPAYRTEQGYLDAPPDGIGLAQLGAPPPRGGHALRIVDIEGDWCLDHESFATESGPVLLAGDLHGASHDERSHGAAVLAILSARGQAAKVEGLAPTAELHVASYWSGGDHSVGAAVRAAAPYLGRGDIMLLEVQVSGPNDAWIPVEWTEDVFLAVRDLTAVGILVVAAAGNGRQNLDDPVYQRKFDRSFRDSGAILVGAGNPPHGNGPPRWRAGFSNHGACVDVQAWGDLVTTAGYGDLQGASQRCPERSWYTREFSGTSSASAIVAGALARLQQELVARARAPLHPRTARDLLRACGSGPLPACPTGQGIGLLPDLRLLLATALALPGP